MMPKKLPKGVSIDRDRYKNVRLYFRAPGRPKVRLHEEPGTKAFEDEVSCARLGIPYEKPAQAEKRTVGAPPKENSFQWLVQQYKTRAKNRLNPEQLARRVRLLEEICDSGKKRRGDLPYKMMERKHVLEIRDTIRDTAGAQNNVVKTISAMFGWAISAGLADRNPAIGIEHLHSGDGFHAWTVDEVRQFEARHPLGSKARLALHLGLFTGFRLSDLATLGKQHVRDGWLYVRPGKTGKSSGVVVEIPLLPELQAVDPCDKASVGRRSLRTRNESVRLCLLNAATREPVWKRTIGPAVFPASIGRAPKEMQRPQVIRSSLSQAQRDRRCARGRVSLREDRENLTYATASCERPRHFPHSHIDSLQARLPPALCMSMLKARDEPRLSGCE